jgi:hypothetical protein
VYFITEGIAEVFLEKRDFLYFNQSSLNSFMNEHLEEARIQKMVGSDLKTNVEKFSKKDEVKHEGEDELREGGNDDQECLGKS